MENELKVVELVKDVLRRGGPVTLASQQAFWQDASKLLDTPIGFKLIPYIQKEKICDGVTATYLSDSSIDLEKEKKLFEGKEVYISSENSSPELITIVRVSEDGLFSVYRVPKAGISNWEEFCDYRNSTNKSNYERNVYFNKLLGNFAPESIQNNFDSFISPETQNTIVYCDYN